MRGALVLTIVIFPPKTTVDQNRTRQEEKKTNMNFGYQMQKFSVLQIDFSK